MAKNHLIWFIAFAVVTCICQAKAAEVVRLKIKLDKLSRKHEALQGKVDDIWATIITSGIDVQDKGNKTRTDDLSTDTLELILKMNGTLSTFKDLKTEVEHLILTSRNGIKNEKHWQRGAIMNLTGIFADFQLDVIEKNKEVKHHLERLNTKTDITDQACNAVQEALKTKTYELDSKIRESWNEQDVTNELIMKILENLSLKYNELETENQELKQTISIMQKDNQQKLSSMETENQELKQTISIMQKDNQQKLSSIEAESQELKQTISIMQKDNQQKLSSMETESQELKSEVVAGQKDFQKLQRKFEAENQALKETISEIKSVIIRHHHCYDWENFHDHCYLAVFEGKTWDDASAFCKSNDSYLVEITSDEELEFVADLLRQHWFWIGATNWENNEMFAYHHSKQEVPGIFWGNGQPDQRHDGDEHCVAALQYTATGAAEFHDYRCNKAFFFVCEKP